MEAFHKHLQDYPEFLEMKNQDSIVKISAHLLKSSSLSQHLVLYDEK